MRKFMRLNGQVAILVMLVVTAVMLAALSTPLPAAAEENCDDFIGSNRGGAKTYMDENTSMESNAWWRCDSTGDGEDWMCRELRMEDFTCRGDVDFPDVVVDPPVDMLTDSPEVPPPATLREEDLATKLVRIEKEYRAIVNAGRLIGWDVAAHNLEQFLDENNSGTKTIDVSWLRSFSAVRSAEQENQWRFVEEPNSENESLTIVALELYDGETREFKDFWHNTFWANPVTELYYASGDSTLKSTGSFTLTRRGDIVTIKGTVRHYWYDLYDWHQGLFAPITGFGIVSDDDALLLEKHGRGKSFWMDADWTQTVQGTIHVGDLGFYSPPNLVWSDLRES